MLTIVMAKPRQLTRVSEVPLVSCGADCATSVENSGESAMTTRPQKNKKAISNRAEAKTRNKGDARQHKHERNNANVAMGLAPYRCERKPLATHANPPDAMIRKESKDTLS